MEGKTSAEAFPMKGGQGPYSYFNNSSRQKRAAHDTKEILARSIIESLDLNFDHTYSCSPRKILIADLGCSVGANTFIAMQTIIDAVRKKCEILCQDFNLVEIQVFFNDHASNDFTTLFLNLPQPRTYFAAGVPGSFHGRLFLAGSLDVVHSSYALHWLSRAPPEVGDLKSPLCNKGRIHYAKAPDEVGEAYGAQFAKDMELFLDARSAEVKAGGVVVFQIPGRPDEVQSNRCSSGPFFWALESCLVDMAKEVKLQLSLHNLSSCFNPSSYETIVHCSYLLKGVIEMDQVDSFNLPIYGPSMAELRMLVEANGSFTVEKMELIPNRVGSAPQLSSAECRAGMESILEKHFGCSKIIEQLFARYEQKVETLQPVDCEELAGSLFVLLKRKY